MGTSLTAPQGLALTFITLKALHRPSQYQSLCAPHEMCPPSTTVTKTLAPDLTYETPTPLPHITIL